eukprot:m.46499 g.46499  ORF g.46499 m.46499 type:complete len:867 (+) comp11864_c0_seq1:209-2809(+)
MPCHEYVERWLEDAMYRLGKVCGGNPLTTIAIGVSVVLVFLSGIHNFEYNGDVRLNWTPEGSYAHNAQKRYAGLFGEQNAQCNIVVERTDDGGNVLDDLSFVAQLESIARAITVVDGSGGQHTFDDLCQRAFGGNNGPCVVLSPFSVLSNNASGTPTSLVLANARRAANGTATFASATLTTFLLRSESNLTSLVDDFQAAFIDRLSQDNVAASTVIPNDVDFGRLSFRSFDDEIQKVGIPDFILLLVAVVAMVTLVSLTVGKRQFDPVASRLLPGVAGVGLVPLALVFAGGLSLLVGKPLNMISAVTAFLLLAVGIDDVFVLIKAFDELQQQEGVMHENTAIVDQVARALSSAGGSITVTSVTDFVAFMTGLSSTIPQLQDFCFVTAMGVFAVWALVITLGTAFVALDAKRQSLGRLALTPWKFAERRRLTSADDSDALASVPTPMPVDDSRAKGMLQAYTRTLLTPLVKAVVIVVFVALLSTSLFALTRVITGFVVDDHIPDGSYIAGFLEILRRQFGGFTLIVDDVVENADLRDATVRQHAIDLQTSLANISNVPESEPVSFLPAFEVWAANQTCGGGCLLDCRKVALASLTLQEFASCVQEFTSQQPVFNPTLVFRNGILAAFRIEFVVAGLPDFADVGTLLERVKDVTVSFSDRLDNFAYSFTFGFGNLSLVTGDQLRSSLIIAAVAVFCILLLFSHPVVAVVVCGMVASILVMLVAMLAAFKIAIGPGVLGIFIMSVGFSVDYSVHVGHAYMVESGTAVQRAEKALYLMAKPVLLGGLSTVVGVVALVFTPAETYRVFFYTAVAVVILGLLHGLVLLPVVLSCLPLDGEDEAGAQPEQGMQLAPRANAKLDASVNIVAVYV